MTDGWEEFGVHSSAADRYFSKSIEGEEANVTNRGSLVLSHLRYQSSTNRDTLPHAVSEFIQQSVSDHDDDQCVPDC